MALFSLTSATTDTEDMTSPAWLIALGIVFLFATILSDLSDMSFTETLASAAKTVDLLRMYLVL